MFSTQVLQQAHSSDLMSRYAFERDDIGNWIIPGSAFGGTQDVKVSCTPRGIIVIEVVAAIMAINQQNRNVACECWRETLKPFHALIQHGLMENEGKYIFVIKILPLSPPVGVWW